MYKVYLKRGEERRIKKGHPWVYANEVQTVEGKAPNGSLAEVYDSGGNFLGKGYINRLSKILVRLFIYNREEEDTEQLFSERLIRANALRENIGLGEAYRLCFSESDGLPSLIVDRYGDVYVVEILSLGMRLKQDTIVSCLVKAFHPKCIYSRSDAPVLKKEGLEPLVGVLYGELPERVRITENGIKLDIDIVNGQKTGYYLDQKENRLALRRYAKGKTVLDCFCNVGGFSLNTAMTASRVKAVDISQTALDELTSNAALNGFNNIETECADVFEYLRSAKKRGEKYDLIVLDPPAFCKSAAEIPGAVKGYRDINIAAMKLLTDGGILATASCSHYMGIALFEKTLSEAAAGAGKRIRILERRMQSPDHPADLAIPESEYLKFYILSVDRR